MSGKNIVDIYRGYWGYNIPERWSIQQNIHYREDHTLYGFFRGTYIIAIFQKRIIQFVIFSFVWDYSDGCYKICMLQI